jgi:hypothetical protein
MNKHTILFNIASRNVNRLSPELEQRVWEHIENVMNGDNLYGNASREIILEAYYHQEACGRNWAEIQMDIIYSYGPIRLVCKNTGA